MTVSEAANIVGVRKAIILDAIHNGEIRATMVQDKKYGKQAYEIVDEDVYALKELQKDDSERERAVNLICKTLHCSEPSVRNWERDGILCLDEDAYEAAKGFLDSVTERGNWNTDEYMFLSDFELEYGKSLSTLRKWVKSGKLPIGINLPYGRYMIRRKDFEEVFYQEKG